MKHQLYILHLFHYQLKEVEFDSTSVQLSFKYLQSHLIQALISCFQNEYQHLQSENKTETILSQDK